MCEWGVACIGSSGYALSVFTMQEVDLYTVKVEDLNFSAPFTLHTRRQDFLDAFVCYFIVSFNKCHRIKRINTSEY